VELKRDDESHPPVYYGRLLLGSSAKPAGSVIAQQPQRRMTVFPIGDVPFWKYAYIPTRSDTLRELAVKALAENWYFGQQPPAGFQYPILDNYLTYTFRRLLHERPNKVLVAADKSFSAFNTGLVDRRFEPLYALLAPNRYGGPQPWALVSFCVAGEGRAGKELVSHF